MLPHPILMDTLWSDRNRTVLANETRQQRLAQLDEKPAATPPRQPHRAVRMLAVLALALGLRMSNTPGVSA